MNSYRNLLTNSRNVLFILHFSMNSLSGMQHFAHWFGGNRHDSCVPRYTGKGIPPYPEKQEFKKIFINKYLQIYIKQNKRAMISMARWVKHATQIR